MKKLLCFLSIIIACWGSEGLCARRNVTPRNSRAAAVQNETPISGYTYNYMYPYLNNQMKTDLNPGTTTAQNTNPINAVVKTSQIANKPMRNVVPRAATKSNTNIMMPVAQQYTTNNAPTQTYQPNVARAATPSQRRVVSRSNVQRGATIVLPDSGTTTTNQTTVSTARCFADYADCMNNYCARPDTPYNKCYCSAQLAQIEAQYKSEIDSALTQLARLQGINQWTDDEMNEYWGTVIGKYSNSNAFENIDAALDIDWSSLESRVRGQNAFITGHEYCVQHLRNCAYAASNLRDAYRSEIARDCAAYEASLQRIKNAANAIIEEYK
ncbi:MAG: hypothetical protein MJ170_03190 [Alphaproteobacteria bacterium]|nr:hypothetical protein [Alphaproteobacteria bacterium]